MSAPDLREASCKGRPQLFESLDAADHEMAAAICAWCPVRVACKSLLLEVQREATALESGGGPVGTWAGELIGSRVGRQRRALPREHGTDRGYYQHRHRREDACAGCKAAHARTWKAAS